MICLFLVSLARPHARYSPLRRVLEPVATGLYGSLFLVLILYPVYDREPLALTWDL